jgi:hypothetical protein
LARDLGGEHLSWLTKLLPRSCGSASEENPHARDDEIARLFIAAAKDNEELVRQITEWVFNAS